MLTKSELADIAGAALNRRQRSTLWYALKQYKGKLEGAPIACALAALRAQRAALARSQVRVAMGESAYNARKLNQRLGAVDSALEALEKEST